MKSEYPGTSSEFRGRLAAAFVTAFVGATAQAAPIFFKQNVPDFYQHQKAGEQANKPNDNPAGGANTIAFNDAAAEPGTVPSYNKTPNFWEDGGGWCCVAAFVNSFYFLEKTHGFDGLFTRADGRALTWQEQMIFAIEDLARDMGLTSAPPVGADPIPRHVRKLEAGKRTPLSFAEFNVTAGFGTAAPTVTRREADAVGDFMAEDPEARTLFDLYRTELCRSEDVTIRIQFPKDTGPADGSRPWWAQDRGNDPGGGAFHVMTGAGVEGCEDTTKSGRIYVADPDKRNQQVGNAFPGPVDVRERYPYDAIPLLPHLVPVPAADATEAQRMTFYDEFSLDANGCITASPDTPSYVGACIRRLSAISPTPEPATAALLAAGLAVLGALSRRRRRHMQ